MTCAVCVSAFVRSCISVCLSLYFSRLQTSLKLWRKCPTKLLRCINAVAHAGSLEESGFSTSLWHILGQKACSVHSACHHKYNHHLPSPLPWQIGSLPHWQEMQQSKVWNLLEPLLFHPYRSHVCILSKGERLEILLPLRQVRLVGENLSCQVSTLLSSCRSNNRSASCFIPVVTRTPVKFLDRSMVRMFQNMLSSFLVLQCCLIS